MRYRDLELTRALESGDADAVDFALQRVLAQKTIFPIWHLLKGESLMRSAVSPSLHLRLATGCAHALLDTGQALLAKDLLAAAFVRSGIASDDPALLKACLLLAVCQFKASLTGDALDTIADAVKRFPESDQPARIRLAILAKTDPGAALAALQVCDAKHPKLIDLHMRAAVLLTNDLVDDARSLCASMEPDSVEKWLTLSNISARSGRREAWAAALDAGIAAASGSNEAYVSASALRQFDALRSRAPVAPPTVSPVGQVVVILYTRDSVESLAQAADSVLQQSWRALRLVIVDDASCDGTADIIREIAKRDPRVVIIVNARPLGPFRSRNLAIELVHGNYYAMHAADRWMHPRHLDYGMGTLVADQDLKAHYAALIGMDRRGTIMMETIEDRASGLFPRIVFEETGCFDAVLAGGDEEFQWRLRARYGSEAVRISSRATIVELQDESAVPKGADDGDAALRRQRADYAANFLNWHLSCGPGELCLDPELLERPFPAPAALIAPSRQPAEAPDLLSEKVEQRAPGEADTPLVVRWPDAGRGGLNWGDKLNPFLVQALSGRRIINHSDRAQRPPGAPVHFVVGSGVAAARRDAMIWGSGFISSDQNLSCPVERIFAVRGPLTRQKVVEAGGDPMLPLGDPALLMPLFYLPAVEPTFDIGIIQHFRDSGQDGLPSLPRGLSTRLISITGGIVETIDAILSCRILLSSSLHGLIIAHAYGRGGAWLKSSDRPLGDDFKFRDYWASMGWFDHEAHDLRTSSVVDPVDLVSAPDRSAVDLFSLIRVCPFITDQRRNELLQRAASLSGSQTFFAQHAGLRSIPHTETGACS